MTTTTDDPDNTLAAALVALQSDMPPISKDATGQYGNYADLADVTKALLPVMTACGLAFSAKPTMVIRDDGAREFVLAYKLVHAPSGESETGEYPLGTGNPQQLGSAITYARRFSLCAITGAVADIDDDGQRASEPAAKPKAARAKPPERASGNLPRNTDGSTSRSRTTDAELTATGQMTDQQMRDHGRLERDVKGTGPQGAARLSETPPDDPFYDAPPPAGLRTPQAAGNPVGIIQAHFKRLGYTDSPEDRTARIKRLGVIIGRTITSTNDLTAGEGIAVKAVLEKCRDQAALDEWLAVKAGEDSA